jgi:hypothetical protein
MTEFEYVIFCHMLGQLEYIVRATNCMEQSPSREADSRSASQEIQHLLWNQKVHYRFHKSPPFYRLLCQMNAIHTIQPYFPKIYFVTCSFLHWGVQYCYGPELFSCSGNCSPF